MRSIADSRRATTAAASSRSRTELPWTPGSWLVRRSSTSASCSARAASRAASSSSTHGVGSVGRKTTSVPAVRQPSQGCGSASIALAQRAHDDRVLLAHAQQHQVQRQLEAEVLEEQREVEALVELDGDEDGLDREAAALGVHALARTRGPGRSAGRRSPGTTSRTARRRRAPGRAACSKNDWPRISWAGRPNSSSAGSDHLETEPWPSVRTK